MRFDPPSEARDHIEWRMKGLPTYLVHGSHEAISSEAKSQFSRIVIRKVCPLAILPVF